jgi:hypothetical protein
VNPQQPVPAGAQLLLFAILFVLFLLARWVYRDAKQNGLSKAAALSWAALTFFAWVAVFVYMGFKFLRARTKV